MKQLRVELLVPLWRGIKGVELIDVEKSTLCLSASPSKGRQLSLILLLFFQLHLQAQTLTTTDILLSAKTDDIYLLENKLKENLADNPQKLPFLDELEFRTEMNEFDVRRQEYAVRLSGHTWGQVKQQKKKYNAALQVADAETQIQFFDALEDRYQLLIAAKFAKDFQSFSEELIVVLEDEKTLIENELALGLADDFSNLIDIEEELQDGAISILDLKQLQAKTDLQIKNWLQNGTSVNFSDFVSIEKVRATIASVDEQTITNHPEIIQRNLRIQLAQTETQIERKEAQNYLKFLQVRFSDNPNDLIKERFSIGAGFRIPTKSAATLKIKEAEAEVFESTLNVQREKLDLKAQLEAAKSELSFQLERWDLHNSQYQTFNQKYNTTALVNRGITDAMLLLKTKERLLKKQLQLKKLELDIYEKYLDLLVASGKMMELPLRNYVSDSFPEF